MKLTTGNSSCWREVKINKQNKDLLDQQLQENNITAAANKDKKDGSSSTHSDDIVTMQSNRTWEFQLINT